MALTGLVWGLGCILGPLIGGGFSDSSATWRWAFYINLLLFAVCSPVYLFVLESIQPDAATPFAQKLRRLDWVGVVLNAGIYVTFVMVFTFGGATWAWNSGRTISLFVVFGVVLLAFCVQQGLALFTTTTRRLFPVDFLRSRTQLLLYISTSATATCLFVPIYYIPLYFSFVHGDSGIMAAVRLLPFICLNIAANMVSGALMPKYGFYVPWYLAGSILSLIGGSLMYALIDTNTSKGTIYGLSILVAVGAGFAQQAAYSVSPAKVSHPSRVPDAIGFINVAQIGGIVISLTITSTVFQNVGFSHLQTALAGTGLPDHEIRAALAGAKSAALEGLSPELKRRVTEGIVAAIGDGWILLVAAGAVGVVAAAGMRWERLFMEVAAGG
ncbi:MFS general substrate transporter [Aulographum hederae CBS 113979]|uniref:MFS general substrate transporter n=1 Tax=Aulographum hederae CBS 113979 TaxID=1176131 RepID=A0A6G1GIS3_9PEZI|nr:MFS general substrate transporter [Aulographum hederae CBS 113979]